MAQSGDADSPLVLEPPLQLNSPADKVYDIFRRKCYLFKDIMPNRILGVQLIKGEWDSLNSERCWTFAEENCGSWKDIVHPIEDQRMSITWNLKDGEVPNILYKTLYVKYQFSPDGEGCLAKASLHFQRKHANGPNPTDYIAFIREMIIAVDEYLPSIERDA